jgi:hypothetical protein
MPVVAPTVATAVLLLIHVPLTDVLVSVIVPLWQTTVEPDIVDGAAITLMVRVAAVPQPVL